MGDLYIEGVNLTAGFAATPSGITDGQTLQWDAASNRFSAVNQGGTIAYAENITAQPTAAASSGLGTAIPGMVIYVPGNATNRDVYIEFGCQIGISTGGQGVAALRLSDWSNPAAWPSLPVEDCIFHFDSGQAATPSGPSIRYKTRIGQVTTDRIFVLSIWQFAEGSSLSLYCRNGGAANASYHKTWMQAVAQ